MALLKQNSRNRQLLIVGVVVIGLFVLMAPTLVKKARTLFLGGNLMPESYSICDTASVDRIFIGSGHDSLLLSRTAQGWSVNGRVANHALVSGFLSAFQSIDVFAPIPKMVDSVIQSQLLASNALRIRFGSEGEWLRNIRLVYTDTLGLGTVALAEGNSSGAVIRTAKQGARLGDMVSVNPSFWVNSRLVTASESEITEVVFKNLIQPDSSFTIRRNGKGFQVVDGRGVEVNRRVNLRAVSRYLNYLTRMSTIAVVEKSIQEKSPLYSISITSSKGTTSLDFIPMPSRTNLDATGKKARFDYDYLFILMNGTNLYTAYWADVDLTIKSISYFFE